MIQQWYPQMNTATSQVSTGLARPTPYGSNLMIGHSTLPVLGSGDANSMGGALNWGAHVDPEARLRNPNFPGVMNSSPPVTHESTPGDHAMLGDLQTQLMVQPVDPYFIGDGTSSFYEFIYPFCDWTFLLMIVFFLASIVGVSIVLGESRTDNVFAALNVSSMTELDAKIATMKTLNVSESEGECSTSIFGSFGKVCLYDSINSYVFVMLLSHLNVGRGALWCLAVFFSSLAVVFALVIHAQRNPRKNPFETPFFQAEFLQMTPAQQALFLQQNMQQMQGCCGSSGVSVYDTPYYAFFRFAWGFVGCVAFIWVVMLLIPFFVFVPYFIDHTTEDLHEFWESYYQKYLPTILCVGAYLAWPIICHVLEAVVWVVGIIPWFAIRTCLKPGIERFRPEMSLSELPGYIRADMFFMDLQDVKRFGFSRLQWALLTDTHTPFFDCCEDPLLIRDPATMQAMVRGPGGLLMSQAAAAAAAAAGSSANGFSPDGHPGSEAGRMAQPGSTTHETGGDGREERSKRHYRTRHRREGESSKGENSEQRGPSPGHRHHRSRGKDGESRSGHHRSGSAENSPSGSAQNEQRDEAESGRAESRRGRHHRSHREHSGGEGSSNRHHRSGSGRHSRGSGAGDEGGSQGKAKNFNDVSQSLSKTNEQLEALMKI